MEKLTKEKKKRRTSRSLSQPEKERENGCEKSEIANVRNEGRRGREISTRFCFFSRKQGPVLGETPRLGGRKKKRKPLNRHSTRKKDGGEARQDSGSITNIGSEKRK